MAFSWFKKTKNKRDKEPDADRVAEAQQDKTPAAESEAQAMAPEKATTSQNQIAGLGQTANADFSDQPEDEPTAPPAKHRIF